MFDRVFAVVWYVLYDLCLLPTDRVRRRMKSSWESWYHSNRGGDWRSIALNMIDRTGSIVRKLSRSRRESPRFWGSICLFCVLFIIVTCPTLEFGDKKGMPIELDRRGIAEHTVYVDDGKDTCRGKRIFMYDLPPKFNVVVHNESRCNHSLIPWMDLCPRFVNKGYGIKLWDETDSEGMYDADGFDKSSWFDTDSYMLEMIYYNRMQKYRCLTTNSTIADAFFVPFYTGLLALDYLYGDPDLRRTYEKRRLYGQDLIKWLEENGGDGWTRYGGKDHFLIAGRTTWDFKIRHMWATGFTAMPYASNMTHLLLERKPDMEHEMAIPYPTSFHPGSPERLQSWMQLVKKSERKFLFSYVGAPRPDLWSVRGIIANACMEAGPKVCNLVSCTVVRCSHDPFPIYKSFLQSDFCLQPRGDTATRRSTFDCLISGAIPVYFHDDTVYTQYYWHLPNPKSYSVFISEKHLKNGTVSIEKMLRSYSQQRIMQMRKRIMSLAPSLLYNDFENEEPGSMPDAFEVSIQKVLRRMAITKLKLSQTHWWNPFRPRHDCSGPKYETPKEEVDD